MPPAGVVPRSVALAALFLLLAEPGAHAFGGGFTDPWTTLAVMMNRTNETFNNGTREVMEERCEVRPPAYSMKGFTMTELNGIYMRDLEKINNGVPSYWTKQKDYVLWWCAISIMLAPIITSSDEWNHTSSGSCQDVGDRMAWRPDARPVTAEGVWMEWIATPVNPSLPSFIPAGLLPNTSILPSLPSGPTMPSIPSSLNPFGGRTGTPVSVPVVGPVLSVTMAPLKDLVPPNPSDLLANAGYWHMQNVTVECEYLEEPLWLGAAIMGGIVYILIIVAIVLSARPTAGCVLPPNRAPPIGNPMRVWSVDIVTDVKATDGERQSLPADIDDVSLLVSVWRRTTLSVAALLHFLALPLLVIDLYIAKELEFSVGFSSVFPQSVVRKWATYFQMLAWLGVAQCLIAFAFYLPAAYHWRRYERSRTLCLVGYAFVFFLPFLFYFVPWTDIARPQDATQYMCGQLMFMVDEELPMFRFTWRQDASVVPGMAKWGSPTVDVLAVCALPPDEVYTALTNVEMTLRQGIDSANFLLIAGVVSHMSAYVMRFLALTVKYAGYLPFVLSAIQVLIKLLPGTLGLLTGMIKGLKLVKTMMPMSRLTTWILVLMQGSALPILMLLNALLMVVVGTIPATVAAILLTLSQCTFIFTPMKLLRANTKKLATAAINFHNNLVIGLMVAGVVALGFGIVFAPHIRALRHEAKDFLSHASTYITISALILQTLGGSVATYCIFFDVSVTIILSTRIGESRLSADMQKDFDKAVVALAAVVCGFTKPCTLGPKDVPMVRSDTQSGQSLAVLQPEKSGTWGLGKSNTSVKGFDADQSAPMLGDGETPLRASSSARISPNSRSQRKDKRPTDSFLLDRGPSSSGGSFREPTQRSPRRRPLPDAGTV